MSAFCILFNSDFQATRESNCISQGRDLKNLIQIWTAFRLLFMVFRILISRPLEIQLYISRARSQESNTLLVFPATYSPDSTSLGLIAIIWTLLITDLCLFRCLQNGYLHTISSFSCYICSCFCVRTRHRSLLSPFVCSVLPTCKRKRLYMEYKTVNA